MLFLCRLVASLHFGFSGGAAAVVLVAACGRGVAVARTLSEEVPHTIYQKMTLRVLNYALFV